MKDSIINAAAMIVQTLGPAYRNNKRELSSIDKALYESAQKRLIQALAQRGEAGPHIERFDADLEAARARAESARAARDQKKGATGLDVETSAVSTGTANVNAN